MYRSESHAGHTHPYPQVPAGVENAAPFRNVNSSAIHGHSDGLYVLCRLGCWRGWGSGGGADSPCLGPQSTDTGPENSGALLKQR